ncbi:MAG: DUF411 domain-containing protein [Magnetospirillum sp.]|nr:DUF411 domain-containing protein [Magnetospirillum sp.]
MGFRFKKSKRAVVGSVALALVVGAATLLPVSTPAVAREAVVYKNPACGCCKGWATYLQRHGYTVTVIDSEDMDTVKDDLGVPKNMRSCHTAKIDGTVVEGHVPLEAIERFLAEPRTAKGIASPGMPSGSPGMDGPKDPNPVFTFGAPGKGRLLGTY